MPTYEYQCTDCGHEFERFQKMSDEPVKVCPECGEPKVQRRISTGGGVVFKGPGFYATDYRKSPPPKEKEAGSAESGKSASSGESGKPGPKKEAEE
jgi:putative FmdB family regulatory protein